jgi:putative DNA primase/helicase
MEYRNLADVVAQLESAGLLLNTVKKTYGGTQVGSVYVESTKSVRCDVSSETKKGTGAYRLHELRLKDGIWLAGAYWLDHGSASFKLDLNKECAKCGAVMPLKASTCACGSTKLKSREIPPEEVEAHKKRMAENKRQAEASDAAKAEQAAKWADAVWLASREIFSPDEHDYLARKQLKTAHGCRVFESNEGVILDGADNDDYKYLAQFWGALVVPMLDERGKRRGLQFILSREKHKDLIARRERDKEYWPRGIGNHGLRYVIGGALRDVGLVAEGFATAASLHEATGLPVAVAFDAGSLPKVGESLWKAAKKRVNLLFCADDDWLQRCAECKQPTPVAEPNCTHCGKPHGKRNAGCDKAKEAAAATGGAWVAPIFAAARPTNRKGPTDFNDLRVAEGIQAVTGQIEAKLAASEWVINGAYSQGGGGLKPPPGSAGAHRGGGGGNGGIDRPAAESILTLDEAVERFIFIDDDTGEFVFDSLTRNVCKRTKMLKMLAARVRDDDVKDHPRWRQRAVYIDQIGFDPGGEDKNIICNRWAGWPTVPKQGSCELLLELLQHQCSGEDAVSKELYQWVLRWLAYPLQHPGAKMQTAIVMHGPQGTGKGRFFETYAKIFGEYGLVLNQEALEDKFNSDWQERKLFILADEIVARAEMYHIKNRLKNFVTGEWVRVNPKNVAAHRERNHMQIVFLSNEKQPLVLENDDRRYCVIWTPPPVGQQFYDELSAEIDNGGIAALHWYLLNEVELGDFKPWTRPPMTEAKRELIDIGRDSVDRFLIDWQAGDLDVPFCPCSSSDLYRAYLYYCRANGERMPRPENHFSGHIIKLPGWSKGHKDVMVDDDMGHRASKRVRMILPSDAALNEAAKRGNDCDFRREDGQTLTEWLTPCFFTFRQALKVEP